MWGRTLTTCCSLPRWRWTPRRSGIARGPKGFEVRPRSLAPWRPLGSPSCGSSCCLVHCDHCRPPPGKCCVEAGAVVHDALLSVSLLLQFPWSQPSRSCSGQCSVCKCVPIAEPRRFPGPPHSPALVQWPPLSLADEKHPSPHPGWCFSVHLRSPPSVRHGHSRSNRLRHGAPCN